MSQRTKRVPYSGVYKITCSSNGRCYVGSSKDVHLRLIQHKSGLRSGNHYNRKLQNSWNVHGADAFTFELIAECAPSDLITTEQKYIEELFAFTNGFNLRPRAEGNSGFRWSPEMKAKMSEIKKNTVLSSEVAERKSSLLKARSISEEWRYRMVNAMGGKRTPEHARKVALANRKITTEQLSEVRRMLSLKVPYKVIAKIFGISKSTVGNIVGRKGTYDLA